MVKDILLDLQKLNLLKEYELRIGGFEFYPSPDIVIGNCDLCNKELYGSIDEYNSTKNIESLANLTCDCYKKYLIDKNNDNQTNSIDDRISIIMTNLFKKYLSKEI